MIAKLTRIWMPNGVYGENIAAEMDGEWHRKHHESMIEGMLASNNYAFMGEAAAQETYLRRTYKFRHDSFLNFYAQIADDVRFEYNERFNRWVLYSTQTFPSDDEEPGFKFYGYMGCLSLDNEWQGIFRADLPGPHDDPGSRSFAHRRQFTTDWLPFFRRSCWLCGCAIEPTAHEKFEWIQGFTPEELESWDLKM